MRERAFAVALFVLLSSVATASAGDVPGSREPESAVSPDGLWSHIPEQTIQDRPGSERALFPNAYRTFALANAELRATLRKAPMEFTPGAEALAVVITLPMPDGSFQQFAIQESPMLAPDLAALLPDVKTYSAQGIDDPSATGRLDFTPAGFHGFILSDAGAVYIDPYRRGDTTNYMAYWRRDYARPSGEPQFSCDVMRGPRSESSPGRLTAESASRIRAFTSSGPTLRTYRLAMAATGEYTAFHGGTVAGAQAAIVTTINRVNSVYEREIAVRLTLVNNASIVFTNAGTDPYANTSDDIDLNQTVVDNAIGSANYDVGHLVGTGGGGLAMLGAVCWTGYKARGLTGSPSPVGDPFDIDYVAHELGHQFGAEHTFNGTTGSCGGGNRSANSAYEPGSGSTIMAYAGICGAENLQANSDPYFHGRSYDQIVAYTTDTRVDYGGYCPAQTLTANSAPVVTPGSAITIPANTPFALTGSATDPNGDALTYGWEEFDLGTAAPPATDDGSRPIFRSFNPATSPTRLFPKLSDILAGTVTFGESLPTTTRTMTFRLSVRDNKAGGGGVDFGTRTVNVTSAAGPFSVTAPNSAVSWAGGSTQTVTWNVASTTAAPVNCANVNILLSADGGSTFPTTVLAATPNDGTQSITVPSVPTTTARIKVECATAPFFNISRPNFTITGSIAAPTNVTATAIATGTVRLSWTGVAVATAYDVYRRGAGGSFEFFTTYTLPAELLGSTGTLTYDVVQPAGTSYLYKMRAVVGYTAGAESNIDVATTVIFTDDPLVVGTTKVKAIHITQLRTAAGAIRQLAGLGAATFTDATLTGVLAKSVHVTELRTAVTAARTALTLPAATFTNSAAAGTVIAATDVTQLRNAVK